MLGGSTAILKDDRASDVHSGANRASDGVDIGDVVRALLARTLWLVPCIVLTLAAAAGYFFVAPKVYVAKLTMFVDPRDPASLGIDGAHSPQNPDPALVESQMRLLTSGEVLRRVAEVELGLSHADGSVGQGESRSGSGQGAEAAAASTLQVASLVDKLALSVSAKHSDKDYIVDIEVRAPSRDQALRRANTLVSAYFDNDSKVDASAASRQGAWLDQRIAELRARTEAAEKRVTAYKADQGLVISAAGELPTEQQLKDADAALVNARAKKAEAAGRLEQIRAAMNAEPISDAVPEAVRSPSMLSLWSAYAGLVRQEASLRPIVGPLHPEYVALKAQVVAARGQIQAEMRRIAATAERELAAAASSERSAAQQVKALGASINSEGPQRSRLEELQREASAIRATYEKALVAVENVQRNVVHAALATVVDPPSAAFAPAAPKLSPLLLIGAAAGVNLWILLALIAEYLSRSARAGAREAVGAGRTALLRPFWKLAASPRIFHSVDLRLDAPFLMRATDGFGGSKSELRAIRRNLRAGSGYAVRTQEILDCALATARRNTSSLDRAPRIALAGASAGVGASTLAISLAELAAAEGAQVLIDDLHPNRSSAMAHAEDVGMVFLSPNGRRIHVLRPRGSNGGAIFVAGPKPGGREISAPTQSENVDLILVDIGSSTVRAGLSAANGAADALIVVDREGSEPRQRKRTIERLQALGTCACIVVSPAIQADNEGQ